MGRLTISQFQWLCVLGAFALGVAMVFAPTGPADFKLFWFVGGHPDLAYNLDLVHRPDFAALGTAFANGQYLPFGYPPPMILLLRPLSLLSPLAGKMLWSGGWCAAFVFVAARDSGWATPALALSLPLLWCAAIGQTGLLIAALVIAGFQRLEERPQLAGVLLAVAACIKPQALMLAPIVLWGRWTTVRAALVTSALVFVASLNLGLHLWADWLSSIPKFAAYVQPTFPKVSPPYLFASPVWRIGIGVVGIAFAACQRGLIGLLVGTLLCSPYVQFYDLAGLSFLGAVVVARRRGAPAIVVLFGAALVLCIAWPIFTTAYCAGLIALAIWMRGRGYQIPHIGNCSPPIGLRQS
jgi:hypothetical protein